MKKWLKYSLIIFVSCIALFSFKQSLAVQSRFLKYFPSNTSIDYERKTYAVPVAADPNTCQAINSLQEGYNYCTQCMSLKDDCPDCCLVDTNADQVFDAVDCTSEASNENYDCDTFVFSGDNCPGVECPELENPDCSNEDPPGCQINGCPGSDYEPEYDSGEGEACTKESGIWYCTENDLTPVDMGCVPDPVGAIDNYDPEFHSDPSTELFYQTDISGSPPEIEDDDPDFDSNIADSLGENLTSYYKYEPSSAYSSYISSCTSYSNTVESCQKRVQCCQEGTCLLEANPGYGNCIQGCSQRLAFDRVVEVPPDMVEKTCSTLENADCNAIQEEISNCLLGSCATCFTEIDSNFSHDFVAKSGESLTVFWSILAQPNVTPATGYSETEAKNAINTYFYTIAKVINASGATIYSSIMHQKSFNNSFSIFNATHVNSVYLNTGEEYSIKLYYYLPSIVNNIDEIASIQMDINGMEMTIIKIRE
ncbi:MAG: hypothetical protein K9L61_01475 [Candidatus Omnitrophica bacterium]|nr:hypothetical protein [Candidatus Omnitrophota bacterium]